jgi:hypothetical protein
MLNMKPDRLAQLLAIGYARIQAMTFAEGESQWSSVHADSTTSIASSCKSCPWPRTRVH